MRLVEQSAQSIIDTEFPDFEGEKKRGLVYGLRLVDTELSLEQKIHLKAPEISINLSRNMLAALTRLKDEAITPDNGPFNPDFFQGSNTAAVLGERFLKEGKHPDSDKTQRLSILRILLLDISKTLDPDRSIETEINEGIDAKMLSK
ncbi:hypothetical protein JW962_00085 [Candidatus Dojkabacteria bacterium]|nr:hypothetical protein [Candidatus Dojkabacteria bacterium]